MKFDLQKIKDRFTSKEKDEFAAIEEQLIAEFEYTDIESESYKDLLDKYEHLEKIRKIREERESIRIEAKNKEKWVERCVKYLLGLGVPVFSIFVYVRLYEEGLEFEKTDTIRSIFTKNLLNRMSNYLKV